VIGNDGQIAWPDDPKARHDLACDLLGARVVGAVDVVVQDAQALVDGRGTRNPPPDEAAYERRLIAAFAALSQEQRAAIKELLSKTCGGALYWMLVKLTHFHAPAAYVELRITTLDEASGTLREVASLADEDLFSYYFDWVEKFSDTLEP
jgi:hypothetical protein